MRKLMTLLIAFELILSSALAQSTSCPTGFEFSSTLNRCLSKEETTQVMNATAQCAKDDVACYRENAQKALAEKEATGKVSKAVSGPSGLKSGMNAAAIALPLTVAISALKDLPPDCPASSYYAMLGGAASLFFGDMYANSQHKKRLSDINHDWNKIIVSGAVSETNKDQQQINQTNAQSEAFEMLARSEDSMAKTANTKSKFYMVAVGAFTTSAVIAMIETGMFGGVAKICEPKTQTASSTADKAKTEMKTEVPTEASPQSAPAPANGSAATETAPAAESFPVREGVVESRPLTAEASAPAPVPEPTPQTVPDAPKAPEKLSIEYSAESTRTVTYPDGTKTTLSPDRSVYDVKVPNAAGPTQVIRHSNGIIETVTPLKPPGGGFIDKNYFKRWKQYMKMMQETDNFAAFITLQAYTSSENFAYQSPSLEDFERAKKVLDQTELETVPELLPVMKQISIVLMNQINPFPEAKAQYAGAVVGAAMSFTPIGKTISSSMTHPTPRAILSGVLATWSMVMYKEAKKQEKVSTERAEMLRSMKEEFKSVSGAIHACSPQDRNDPGKPSCYCYTSEGGRNSNRGNSKICQKLWSGVNTRISRTLSASSENPGCITNNKTADPGCTCRKSNTCMRVTMPKLSNIDSGTLSMMNNSLKPLQDMGNGTFDAAKFDADKAGNAAAKISDLVAKLESNPKLANYKKSKENYAAKLQADLMRGAQGISPSASTMGFAGLGSSSLPSSPAEARKALEDELKSSAGAGGDTYVGGGNGEKEEEDMSFSMTPTEEEVAVATAASQVEDVMKEDLDYGENDINKSKENIFEVLSNRYQKSGLKRLFNE